MTAADLARAQGVEKVHLALLILRGEAPKRLKDAAATVVYGRLARLLGDERDRDVLRDDVQEAFLRVLRYVPGARLADARGSTAWLKKVALNRRTDRLRKKKRAREAAERLRGEAAVTEPLEQPAQQAAPDPEALEDYRVELFRRVALALEGRQARAQVTGRRQAELAWRRYVLGHSREDLAHEPGAPSKLDTVSKWLGRGRDQHIVPVLEAWLEELPEDAAEREAVEAMRGFFTGARRADAGKARPDRRKSVSSEDHLTSVQVEARDDLERDAERARGNGAG